MNLQKSPVSSVAFPGTRTAIERCRSRQNSGPTVIENAITVAVIAYPTLSRAVKDELLRKPIGTRPFRSTPNR